MATIETNLGNLRNQGIGNGPARLIFRLALQSRIQTQSRWNPTWGSSYYTLVLCPVGDFTPEETLIEYEVDGALAALMMLHLAVEPYPVSPLLLLATCYPSGSHMGRDTRFYESIIPDEGANKMVSAWLKMLRTDHHGRFTPLAMESAGLLTLAVSINGIKQINGFTYPWVFLCSRLSWNPPEVKRYSKI
jgi:hypothetical protein